MYIIKIVPFVITFIQKLSVVSRVLFDWVWIKMIK